MRARENGAKIIVVDPRTIQMSMMADLHLKLLPGTNVVLLNGLMNIIISEGLADDEFIANRTEGFEDLKKILPRYTPDYVEKIAGIPASELVQAAKMYGSAESSSIVYAMGITQHTTGVDNVLSCANLAMVTGNVIPYVGRTTFKALAIWGDCRTYILVTSR